LHGHDVSTYQGAYNWALVKNSDTFGVCKATEGTTITDTQLSHNWAGMKSNGLLRAAYHFGHPNINPVTQAQFFVKTVKALGLETNDALVLDLEVTDGLGPSAVAAWAQRFTAEVQKQSGKNCWVYTDHSFIANGCCSGLYSQPLWIAAPGNAGAIGDVRPWKVWSLQQYGTINNVDVDVLNGDKTVWGALVNVPKPAPLATLAKYVTDGSETFATWSHGAGQLPSTTLRMTCEHSPGDLFTTDLAAWINDVMEGKVSPSDPMPKGLILYYMKAAN
jgi:GH25 family lysozyme M1 (1,4-beta-N-acetylmuramidase)